MALDLAHRQAARVEADDALVEAGEPRLALGHDLRLEASVAIARHRQVERAVIRQHRLRRIPIAAVAAAPARRIALLVAEMLGQLGPEHALQERLLQLLEHSLLAE